MGIDVVDITRGDAGATDRRGHATQRAIAVWCRRGDVIGVARQPVTNQFRINLGPARLCMFERFDTTTPAPSPITKPSRSLS